MPFLPVEYWNHILIIRPTMNFLHLYLYPHPDPHTLILTIDPLAQISKTAYNDCCKLEPVRYHGSVVGAQPTHR